jgi:hypothetical protein
LVLETTNPDTICMLFCNIYVLKLKFIMKDPTEKHFGDVGILDKYNNNNQAHNSPTLSWLSCVLDLHSTTQAVSRLHAIVLGKSCVV